MAGSSATPHTHAPLRGARFLFSPAGRTTFSGGENHAPQNRAKTPTENKRSKGTQKKQKGPRLGLRGQNPKQETRTTGKPGFGSPRATTPTSAKNDLDLVDERGREGKEAEEEQAERERKRKGRKKGTKERKKERERERQTQKKREKERERQKRI